MRPRLRTLFLASLAAAVATIGCGKPRPNQLGAPQCPGYTEELADALQPCAACHAGSTPAAGYRTDSYFDLLARRPDGSARVVPGDAASAFLEAARGELTDHEPLGEDAVAGLTDWVVRCRANNTKHVVHLVGWMTTTDPDQFHGRVLRADAYQLDKCTGCHGEDLKGGTSQVSCLGCHPSGPLACNVCHGDSSADPADLRSAAPPKNLSGATATSAQGVGAHQRHLDDGPLHKAYACTVCHVVPADPEQHGHYRIIDDEGRIIPKVDPSEVFEFGASFLRSTPGQEARFDFETATCASVYCHRPSAADTAAINPAPTWNRVGQFEAACGTCHGIPPSTHADNRCERCHAASLLTANTVNPERHADGTVDLGDGTVFAQCAVAQPPPLCQCIACHGDATSPAPPRDAQGRTSAALPSVGAHRAHLEAPHQLRGPIECGECHLVPAAVSDPGHLDTLAPAEVFPAGAGTLARVDGAQPSYDPAAATCSGAYCHGGGTKISGDQSPNLNRTPSWTGGTSQIACGTCHGIPPVNAAHPAGINLGTCFSCHNATITPNGNFRITTDPVTGAISTTHLNGEIELGGP